MERVCSFTGGNCIVISTATNSSITDIGTRVLQTRRIAAIKGENGYKEAVDGIGWLACLLWAAGCAASGSPIGAEGNTGLPTGNNGTPAIVGAQTGATCPANNLTQSCSCQNGNETVKGRQTCNISSGWGGCECAAADRGLIATGSGKLGNKSPVIFNWEESMPGKGTCKGGHYAGTFDGLYNSPVMVASPVGIPVVGTVEFDLFQVGNGEYFEIRDGMMDGFALGFVPFSCEIKGTLHCSGDEPIVDAYLKNGNYFVVAFPYIFDGKIVAFYDQSTATIGAGNTGVWAVTEPTNYPDITRDDGSFDATKATFAPIPELTPLSDPDAGFPLMDIFVMGGAGQWTALWTGPP